MIEFLKIRDVKSPKRNEKENAGIDFFIPEYSKDLMEYILEKNPDANITSEGIFLGPSEAILIPTGIKSKFSNNLALVAMNKSGICTKTQLIVGASVIDSSYQGEIHIHMINSGLNQIKIEYGTKLVQFIPLVINNEKHITKENITEDEFFTEKTDRGINGFGSTTIYE